MKATVFDYGAGNLHSLMRALAFVGVEATVESDAKACAAHNSILVLPGVGAFGHAAKRLEPAGEALGHQLRSGRPAVGICLGMQLFFESSEEDAGLGLRAIAGTVKRLPTQRIPHMGWNEVSGQGLMYFAHSYVCEPSDKSAIVNTSTHETQTFAATVRAANTLGVQFHPEKSSRRGLALLKQLFASVQS